MATRDEILQKQEALAQKLADIDTVSDSVVVLLENLTQIIRDLKDALLAAGQDQVKLQAVADAMDAAAAKIDAEKAQLADAVVANTPAE